MPAREIECECGCIVLADTDAGLIRAARQHIAQRHPDLVGRLSDEDLRGMSRRMGPRRKVAEEVGP